MSTFHPPTHPVVVRGRKEFFLSAGARFLALHYPWPLIFELLAAAGLKWEAAIETGDCRVESLSSEESLGSSIVD